MPVSLVGLTGSYARLPDRVLFTTSPLTGLYTRLKTSVSSMLHPAPKADLTFAKEMKQTLNPARTHENTTRLSVDQLQSGDILVEEAMSFIGYTGLMLQKLGALMGGVPIQGRDKMSHVAMFYRHPQTGKPYFMEGYGDGPSIRHLNGNHTYHVYRYFDSNVQALAGNVFQEACVRDILSRNPHYQMAEQLGRDLLVLDQIPNAVERERSIVRQEKKINAEQSRLKKAAVRENPDSGQLIRLNKLLQNLIKVDDELAQKLQQTALPDVKQQHRVNALREKEKYLRKSVFEACVKQLSEDYVRKQPSGSLDLIFKTLQRFWTGGSGVYAVGSALLSVMRSPHCPEKFREYYKSLLTHLYPLFPTQFCSQIIAHVYLTAHKIIHGDGRNEIMPFEKQPFVLSPKGLDAEINKYCGPNPPGGQRRWENIGVLNVNQPLAPEPDNMQPPKPGDKPEPVPDKS